MSLSSRVHGLQPTRLLCPWDSPGKNTGVGRHAFLQGIFLPIQGSNLGLLHCRQFPLCLSHQGSSRYLMRVSREDTKISLNILSLKDTSFLKVADAIVVGETLKIIRLSSNTFQKSLCALCVCVCVFVCKHAFCIFSATTMTFEAKRSKFKFRLCHLLFVRP